MDNIEQIQPIIDNYDKYETYKEQMGRLSKALKAGFYYEALVIDYALLEDRLNAYLYHMAIFHDRAKATMTQERKKQITPIYCQYEECQNMKNVRLGNISGKIKVIRNIMKWALESEEDPSEVQYLKTLRKSCKAADPKLIIDTLDAVDQWRSYRNEIIHALMIKNASSVNQKLEERAREGKECARILDNQLKKIKKNAIRQIAGLSD